MAVLSSAETNSSVSFLDTTLRDGEQTPGVSFRPDEKLEIAKSVFDLGVDRVEVCSAGASQDDSEALKKIIGWAKKNNLEDGVEALTFVSKRNTDWLRKRGCKVSNLLVKGNLRQVRGQLRKTGQEHLQDVLEVLDYSRDLGTTNVYLEDWSRGMKNSWEFIKKLISNLRKSGLVNRLMLCDTVGILSPTEVESYLSKVSEIFPKEKIDFHAHNDYGLATINSGKAIEAGVLGVHTTVNGLGERAGNAPLSQVVMYLEDHLDIDTQVNLKSLKKTSKLVELYSGVKTHPQKPVVGRNAFVHTGGIHHDGELKGNLYTDKLSAERFGQENEFAPGKLSGTSTIKYLEEKLGSELTEQEVQEVLNQVKWLGERKVNLAREDLECLINEIRSEQTLTLNSLKIEKGKKRSIAKVELGFNGGSYKGEAFGEGGFDAFMKVLRKWADSQGVNLPQLRDYEVEIPPGGGTNSLVKCQIEWKNETIYTTFGTSRDQDRAAIRAALRMVNGLQ